MHALRPDEEILVNDIDAARALLGTLSKRQPQRLVG
jgi:hypothetical protein